MIERPSKDKNAGWCNYDWPAADMPAHPPAPFPANDTVSVDALAFLYVDAAGMIALGNTMFPNGWFRPARFRAADRCTCRSTPAPFQGAWMQRAKTTPTEVA